MQLPGALSEIAAVAGEDAALAIAAARGGTEVYIPPEPPREHWLSLLVGHKAAMAIADRLTGGIGVGARVELPLGCKGHQGRARAKVDRLIREGQLSQRQIALATGYTIRGVRIRAGIVRDADRQLPLI